MLSNNALPCWSQLKAASQFLSEIREWPPTRELFIFGTRPKAISLKSLQMLLTQSVYLIFYLFLAHPTSKVFLSDRLWVCNRGEQEESLCLVMATGESEERGEKDQVLHRFIRQQCFQISGGDSEKTSNAMRRCIQACLECFKECRTKGYILPLRLNEAIIKAEMEEFCYVYYSVLTPEMALAPLLPAVFLKAIEETRLFRENALLLRYSNHSLPAKMLQAQKCQEQVANLVEQFQAQRKMFLQDPKARLARSEELVQKFLIRLSMKNVLTLNGSLNQVQQPQKKQQQTKSNKAGRVVNQKTPQIRAIVFSFNVEQLPYQFLSPQRLQYLLSHPELDRFPEEKPTANRRSNQFQLRYAAMTNQIDLRMFSGHAVRPQELDLTAAVLSSLAGALPEVDYSFEESRKAKNSINCVTLRTKAQLHPKESPIAAILESIQRLIADSLVVEHDLRARRPAGERRRAEIAETGHYLLQRVRSMLAFFWGGEVVQ